MPDDLIQMIMPDESLTPGEKLQRLEIMKGLDEKPQRDLAEALQRVERSFTFRQATTDVERSLLLIKETHRHPFNVLR